MQILDETNAMPPGSPGGSTGTPAALPPGYRCSLPDGTPLLLTISRKAILEIIFGGGDEPWAGPRDSMDAITVFWLAAHQPADWMAPGADGMPLYARGNDFAQAVLEWADRTCLVEMHADEVYELSNRFWGINHVNRAEATGNAEGGHPATEDAPPSGGINTPTSSPAETPPNSTT